MQRSNHLIVCGYRGIGQHIADELAARGENFVVIESDAALEESLSLAKIPFCIGDPTDETALRSAGLESARGVITALDSEVDTLMTVIMANRLCPELPITVHIQSRETEEKLRRAGASVVITPDQDEVRPLTAVLIQDHAPIIPVAEPNGASPVKSAAPARQHKGIGKVIYRYRWAIIPFLINLVLLVHARQYWNIFLGSDMPAHFINTSVVAETGQMPTVEMFNTQFDIYYEGSQAPLFYYMTALTNKIGSFIYDDGLFEFTLPLLLLVAIGYTMILAWFIEITLPRKLPLLKAITLLIVSLMPVTIYVMIMYNNDQPFTFFALIGVILMIRIGRQGQRASRKTWIAAILSIIAAVLFKNSGIMVIVPFVVVGAFMILFAAIDRQWKHARRTLLYTGVGLVLMLIPFSYNAWNTAQYTGDAMGSIEVRRTISEFPDWGYWFRFDLAYFANPITPRADSSFWAIQFATVNNNYYMMWNAPSDFALPPEELHPESSGRLPLVRFYTMMILQYVAIPVTAVMVWGFVLSAIRTVRRPRRALRDGSLPIVMMTLAAQGAQAYRFITYPMNYRGIVWARFSAYIYPVLFIYGVLWIERSTQQYSRRTKLIVRSLLILICIAYAVLSIRLHWLPITDPVHP